MKTAIYPLSADPITYGHLNIIERALKIFDKVIVAIGINESKKYLFELDKRTEMVKRAVEKFNSGPNQRINVTSFEGMLTDFAYISNVSTIIRGARNAADFDYEKLLSDINYYQNLGIETVVLFTEPSLSHISSSAAKAIVQNHGKGIMDYVPLFIKEELEHKIHNITLLGVTGGIAAGKSYLSYKLLNRVYDLKNWYKSNHLETNIIDADKVGHYILTKAKNPQAELVREKLVETFGTEIRKINGMIDIEALSRIVFQKAQSLHTFNKIMFELMLYEIRKRIAGLSGLVIINSAVFAEMNLSPLVNNNILIISSPQQKQIERMEERGYNNQKIGLRLDAQYTDQERITAIDKSIKKYHTGSLYLFENTEDPEKLDPALRNLAKEIDEVLIEKRRKSQEY